MQALKLCFRRPTSRLSPDFSRCTLSTLPSRSSSSTSTPSPIPWFVDPSDLPTSSAHQASATQAQSRPSLLAQQPPLPAEVPPESPIGQLHAALSTSPYLEPGALRIRQPIPTALGPALPDSPPKGRRKRGRTYAGEGVYDYTGGIWSWEVVAQVKEGTEKRGAIESVIRIIRKVLLTAQPPLLLPHNTKRRQVSGGWAMIDAGEFAVHIMSREAREKFFPDGRREW